jgi:hypothetical protein
MIFEEKITSSKTSFQMVSHGMLMSIDISAVGTYSGMELCTPIHLNHDYGDVGVVDILVLNAYSGVVLCTPIFLGEASKSFLKFFQNSIGHIAKQSSTQIRVAMWKNICLW